jgi:hypothetical protein
VKRLWASTILACALFACVPRTHIDLPPLIELDDLHFDKRRAADVERLRIHALYVLPKKDLDLSSESRNTALLDLVAVLGDDGALYVNDLVHGSLPAAYEYGKIPSSAITLFSPQGRFEGDARLFAPSEDVLAALDTGYQIDVRVANRIERVIFRPAYDADRYAPYARNGVSPPPAAEGETPQGAFSISEFDGARGKDGSDGGSGESGKNGRSGSAPGQNGGRGGHGGKGADGREGQSGGAGGNGGGGGDGRAGGSGTRGQDGDPAEAGPSLAGSIRPIYSKFYPDEELVFIEVIATYHDAKLGRPYREERKNYVLHRKQPFTVSSIGGRGGEGGAGGSGGAGGWGGIGGDGGAGGNGGRGQSVSAGAGGAGGDGGHGGDGGRGGRGVRGGDGGDGGGGGRGGDGGEIRASLAGSAAFQAEVRASLRFASVAGEGGHGGRGGEAGAQGSIGGGGRKGPGGSGGEGGSGKSHGARGRDGESGKDGEPGSSDQEHGRPGKAGRFGDPGRPRRTPW